MKFKSLIGSVFGRLTVLSQNGKHLNGRIQWLCSCSCGKQITVIGYNLKNGDTRSCGCLKQDLHSKPEGVAAKNRVVKYYKTNAKKRKLSWSLSKEKFEEVITNVCHYCGKPPSNITTDTKQKISYSGIDRVDNTKNYTDDNVVSCCIDCNHAKSDMSYVEFRDWVFQVAHRFGMIQ